MFDHEVPHAMVARLDKLVDLLGDIRDRLPERDKPTAPDGQVALKEPAAAPADRPEADAEQAMATEPARTQLAKAAQKPASRRGTRPARDA